MNQLAALLLLGALGSGTTALPAQAQTPGSTLPPPPALVEPNAPPAGSLSLSQIIIQIESRPDYAFIKEIDWTDGRYEVEYRTRDGRDRTLKIDPRTGRPVEGHLPVPRWPQQSAL